MKGNWYKLRLCTFGEGEGALDNAGFSKTGEKGNSNNADAVQESGTGFSDDISREEKFSKLINEEYKDEFTKKMQSVIDKRFKETKKLESEREALSPILSDMYRQHEVEEGNIEALNEAVSKSRVQRETEEQDALKKANTQVSEWMRQSEELKSVYPSFDFRGEVKGDENFVKLIRMGIPVKTAYEVIHKDEILGSAMEYTAKKVSEHVVKGIEAKASRPQENGLGTKGGLVRKTDVNSLTSQDIIDILKQVEGGANISF